jgi:hypothetical protein
MKLLTCMRLRQVCVCNYAASFPRICSSNFSTKFSCFLTLRIFFMPHFEHVPPRSQSSSKDSLHPLQILLSRVSFSFGTEEELFSEICFNGLEESSSHLVPVYFLLRSVKSICIISVCCLVLYCIRRENKKYNAKLL